jgi:hypothetical protein
MQKSAFYGEEHFTSGAKAGLVRFSYYSFWDHCHLTIDEDILVVMY